MKWKRQNMFNPVTVTLLLVLFSTIIYAQDLTNPVVYLDYIGKEYKEISKDQWDYTSAVAHGKSARKVEKKRTELLETNKTAQKKIRSMSDFEGDGGFRDSVVSFLNMCYHVLNEDYAKIVDMEEIAEQSYDDMEAYLLARDKANEKLDIAQDRLLAHQTNFATKNNITIIESESDLEKKMKAASEMYSYYNEVYLIFFKSYKQEAYLMDALNKKDIAALEQNKRALSKTADEGLEKTSKLSSYKGDMSLITVTRQQLEFYKLEAEKLDVMIDFLMKNEKFEKIKAAFDNKSQKDRTQEDVDQFNNSVNELNKASASYNQVNGELNENRTKNLNNWNKTAATFTDKHTPK